MSEKDNKILKILEDNARLSIQGIAKKTLIPVTTVYNRLKKLEKSGVIKRYTVEYDHSKIGKNTAAYVLLQVNYRLMKKMEKSQHELAKKIKSYNIVEEANLITGTYDILLKLRAESTEALNQFILNTLREMEGVEKTYTIVVMEEI
jgi:DNA-binding Lrp family transcriptional regulator